MQPKRAALLTERRTPDPLRACVHDLRNLFAVVASAKSLLEREPDEQRARMILDALGRVAVDGKIVTDTLLAGDEDRSSGCHAAAELKRLGPIVGALERPGLSIGFAVDDDASWVLVPPAELRAVVLELITNAQRAGARRIIVRATRRGRRCWLSVADDGCGFSPHALREGGRTRGLQGTGMHRLRSAARSASGTVRIRTAPGRGSVVAMILPVIAIVPRHPAAVREEGGA